MGATPAVMREYSVVAEMEGGHTPHIIKGGTIRVRLTEGLYTGEEIEIKATPTGVTVRSASRLGTSLVVHPFASNQVAIGVLNEDMAP